MQERREFKAVKKKKKDPEREEANARGAEQGQWAGSGQRSGGWFHKRWAEQRSRVMQGVAETKDTVK